MLHLNFLDFGLLFGPRPHMGSIGLMDPKPPSSCWYISWPRPRPIAQNILSKSFGPEPKIKFCIILYIMTVSQG